MRRIEWLSAYTAVPASAADKRAAFLQSGAVAVDMESYAIAAVAEAHGLPFIAIRAIVDAAADEVPPALLDVTGRDGRLVLGRLLVRLLAAPRMLRPLSGLAQRFRVAGRSLRESARAGVPGPAPDRATPSSAERR